jgi:uncharacterized protein (TIGR02996 family)
VLDKAHAALLRGDFSTALRELLAVWGTRKIAPLGDAIDAVGRAAAARIEPPTGKAPKDRKAAWLKMARKKDPALTSVLLADVTERLIQDTWERFKKLDLTDPRVVQRIADVVEAAAYNPDTHPLIWKAMFGALCSSEDPRIVERVRGLSAKWDANRALSSWRAERLHERRAGIMPVLEQRSYASATAAEAAACTALVAAIPARAAVAGADELLAAIHEQPDDDAPRMVYMDWLLQKEDPRGDFLRLQLGERDLRREEKLLKQYQAKWLGAIATRIRPKTAVFERGFLASCALVEPQFEIDDDPTWATVRTLIGAVPASDACTVPALRALLDLDRRGITRLATLKKPLGVETLQWSGPIAWTEDPNEPDFMREDGLAGLAALETISVLPKLKRLELHGHAWHENAEGPIARVLKSPCAKQLDELAFPSGYHVIEDWLAFLEPTRLQRIELRDMSGPMWRTSWQAHFERGATGKFSRLRFVASYAHYKSAMQHYMFGHEAGVALDHLDPKRLESVNVEVSREVSEDCRRHLRKTLAASLKRHKRVEAQPIDFV